MEQRKIFPSMAYFSYKINNHKWLICLSYGSALIYWKPDFLEKKTFYFIISEIVMWTSQIMVWINYYDLIVLGFSLGLDKNKCIHNVYGK